MAKHRQIIAKVGEPTCRHNLVTQEKERFQVLRAVCTHCGHVQVHTDAPEEMLSDVAVKNKHGGQ